MSMILHAEAGLIVHCLPLGELMTNCYVLPDDGECWVVDPGLSPQPLVEYLRRQALTPRRVLLTHGHADHIAGVSAVKAAWPEAVVTAPSAEADFLTDPVRNLSLPFGMVRITAPAPDELISPGDELMLGELAWRALDTAGHTPGGLSYYCPAAKVAITGDALFAGSVGRTDIPGASEAQLLANIREHLLTLPDETRILPGHGPPSTIGDERRTNPYLR